MQVVALTGLRLGLGPLLLALDRGGVGGVVHRRRAGQLLDQGLPGARQVAGGQRRAQVDQEPGGVLPDVRGDLGQRRDPVQRGRGHPGLLDGDPTLGQRRLEHRVPPNRPAWRTRAAASAGESRNRSPSQRCTLQAAVRALRSRVSASRSSTARSATALASTASSPARVASTSPSESCHTVEDPLASSPAAAAHTPVTTGCSTSEPA